MEKNDGENQIGSVKFTTTHAKNGNNKTFHIYGEAFVPAKETSTDCQEIDGLGDDLTPPKKYVQWGAINAILDTDGCPGRRNVITFNCAEGRVRSAIMAGLYMIRCLGMTAAEAMGELSAAFPKQWSSLNRQKVQTYLDAYWAQGAYLLDEDDAKLVERERLKAPTSRPQRGSTGRK
jgi:hypothetical protein